MYQTSRLIECAYTRQCRFVLIAALALLSFSSELRAATVTATWNPNPEPNIAGYKLSYGTTSGSYTTTVDVGNVTSTVVTVTAGQKYFFAMRAYNTNGLTSVYSSEVAITIPASTAPTITGLSPSTGAVGTVVTISGSNFGSSKGASTVTFNGKSATSTSWAATSIVVPVPSGTTTGNVIVTVSGVASNGSMFTMKSNSAPVLVNPGNQTSAPGSSVSLQLSATDPDGTAVTYSATGLPTGLSVNSTTGVISGNVPSTTGTYNVTATASDGSLSSSQSFSWVIATPPAGISLVQHVDKDAGTTASTTLAFFAANAGGNFIALALRAATINQTFTVTDSRGNIYKQAAKFNNNDDDTVGLYYAENVGAGSNTVTVSTGAAVALRLSLFEYRGVATSGSLDGVTSTSGASASPASGAITTTSAGDLILGVVSIADVAAVTAGSGFATEAAVPASPGTKLFVEDALLAMAGNITVAATMSASDRWGAAVAAFKAAGSAVSPPSITSLSPATGAIGTAVTIAGANFGSTRGTSTVTFNGTAATPTTWSASSIMVSVPAGATTGNVVVTVGGVASNAKSFTVTGTGTAPSITSLTPASGPVGTPVTIAGANFGSTRGSSAVTFNGVAATPTTWSATSIVVPVPSGATSGNVVVTVGGVASNAKAFTVTVVPAGITLVQHVDLDAGSVATVAKAFTTANAAGNFIALAIRAGKPDMTFTISDTRGNLYRQAARFNNNTDDTVALYYAENIGAGANTVTVSTTTAVTLRLSLLEYSGVATSSSLDGVTTASGTGTSPNSGTVATTANGDLLIGLVSIADVANITPGSGFALESAVPPLPAAKLVVQDGVLATAGSVAATATMSVSDRWGAALAAFKAAGGGAGVMSMAMMASSSHTSDGSRASDFDADAMSELTVFTPSTGKWSVLESSTNYTNSFTLTLGAATDVPVPGDYDGDGKADAAVYTPSTGKWSVLKSSSSYASTMSTTWGAVGDLPVPGDYDGDGITDFATYRPSTGEWLLTLSATQTTRTIVLGTSGDKPVPGDYDGDGRTDLAVFKPSTGAWKVLTSSSNYASQLSGTIGNATDLLVPGDYDGDGRTDMAVFRPSSGAWLILGSANGFTSSQTVTLGASTDIPVPGDYDGDGTTDVAVYRQSTGAWTIIKSTDGSRLTSVWGTSGTDVPVPRHP